MIDWYKQVVFENYANFNGRARRSEYWYFYLCNFIISLVFGLLILFVGSNSGNGAFGTAFYALYGILCIYGLLIIIPTIAVSVRRLHDIGKSGWYYLVGFIPVIGGIILLIWFATEGNPGKNEYGDCPKEKPDSIDVIGIDDEAFERYEEDK